MANIYLNTFKIKVTSSVSFVTHPLEKEYPQTKQLQRMQSLWQAVLQSHGLTF